MRRKRTVLVLDDDETNLMILTKGVHDAGYQAKWFMTGEDAWHYLQHNPQSIDIALIDKMMPGMSGIELLQRMKQSETLRTIPVILQTGDVGVDQMRESIEAGAYYYLTKPFHPEILAALLHSAANECTTREALYDRLLAGGSEMIRLLEKGEFHLRTHEQARHLSSFISQLATEPEVTALGLMELMSNAIEHGNLEIGFDTKRTCLLTGTWEDELHKRHGNPEFGDRLVTLGYERSEKGVALMIRDDGDGFDWCRQMNHDDSVRLNEPNGRGIARAMVSLDDVRYLGTGNEVHCTVKTHDAMDKPYLSQPISTIPHRMN